MLIVEQTIGAWIADSRMELDQVRLLVLHAAQVIDSGGPTLAKTEISYIIAIYMLYLVKHHLLKHHCYR